MGRLGRSETRPGENLKLFQKIKWKYVVVASSGSPGGPLGTFLGRLGGLLGASWAVLGRSLGPLWPVGDCDDQAREDAENVRFTKGMGRFLPLEGPLGGLLRPSSGHLRPSWGALGPSWAVLRPFLGLLEAVFEASWAVLGASWVVSASSGETLRPSWGDPWGLLGRFGASGNRKGRNAKIHQKTKEIQ